jgi:hypothetical protein
MGAKAADDSHEVAAAICLAAGFLDYPTDARAPDGAKDEDRRMGLAGSENSELILPEMLAGRA